MSSVPGIKLLKLTLHYYMNAVLPALGGWVIVVSHNN